MALAGSEKSYSKLFFIVSQLLVVLMLYSVYDESVVRRPWKDYQSEFNGYEQRLAEKNLADLQSKYATDGTAKKITDLKLQLEKAQIERESNEYKTLAVEHEKAKIAADDHELKIKFKKSILDSLYYEYKHAVLENHDYTEKKKAYETLDQEINDRKADLVVEQKALAELKAKLDLYDDKIADLEKQIDDLNAPLLDAQSKVDNIKVRSIEIKQIVVDDFGKAGNINWGRVDRCQTCHTAIDKAGYEDVAAAFQLQVVDSQAAKDKIVADKVAKEPQKSADLKKWADEWVVTKDQAQYLQTMYGTHPMRQELLGKHPVEQYGCTSCHGGDGRGLRIVGKPLGEGDKAHAYHHHAVEPMLRKQQTQANCLVCHNGRIELAMAPDLTKGAELFVQLGCQDCHTAQGYDSLFKVGPDLSKVANKDRTDWMVDWLKNPFNYMPNSRMPNFNLSDEDAVGVVSYLQSVSAPYELKEHTNLTGDISRGAKLFSEVGCRGCHAAESDEKTYAVRARASNLSRIAAKVKNADWVYDWIKNPKNYSPHGRMPNLRLSEQEAADITSYLMSQSPNYSKEIFDRSGSLAAKVDPKKQELIDHGQKVISERGCYSCHNIKGFEKGEKIGPNLSAEALKEAFEFDFGDALRQNGVFTDAFGKKVFIAHNEEEPGEKAAEINSKAKESYKASGVKEPVDAYTNLTDTWQSWVRNKIKYPASIYKHERAQLKMPSFNLSEDELDSLLVFLKGMKAMPVNATFNASLKENQQKIIAGQAVVSQYNCLGCHAIQGFGGEINAKLMAYNHGGATLMQYYPPSLESVGIKIRPEWLYDFLKAPVPYRPAMYVRMPTFGFTDDQANTLIDYFGAMSSVTPQFNTNQYALNSDLIGIGKALTGPEVFNCFSCHLLNGKAPGPDHANWAPDWQNVGARLQYDFIPKWISGPQQYQQFAIMSAFLKSDGEAHPDYLGGKADQQLQALREYILSLDKTRNGGAVKTDAPPVQTQPAAQTLKP